MSPSPSAATVGMVGAGQLARMSQAAAAPLGIDLRLLAARADDAAAQVVPDARVGDWGSLADLRALATGCDVVTFDHELVAPQHLEALAAEGVPLAPPPPAKLLAQDKLHQRRTLARAGLPVPAFAAVTTQDEVAGFASDHGWPVVLKAVRGGYDGRGVWVCAAAEDLPAVWDAAAGAGALLVEAHVPIAVEVAVLTARTRSGATVTYPVVETVQEDGICTETHVPARLEPAVAARASEVGHGVAETAGAVGLCAVELFVAERGEVLVNELALRPHNSGHWTIEGAATSQFANHLRAVLDWPLGAVEATAPAVVTVNVLGPAPRAASGQGPTQPDPRARVPAALTDPGAHVHWYGKEARPGRKIGHVTVRGPARDGALRRARAAATRLGGDQPDEHADEHAQEGAP